jgi:ubiquinol-cytochrome c reductase cytochrome b subunit
MNGTQSSGALAPSQETQSAAPAVVQPPITDGPTLFRERGCAQCHEIRGVGGHKGPDLSGVGRRMKKDALYTQIEQGSASMPPFGGVIEESEITALVKYLGHCKDKTKKSKVVPVAPAPAAEPAE